MTNGEIYNYILLSLYYKIPLDFAFSGIFNFLFYFFFSDVALYDAISSLIIY